MENYLDLEMTLSEMKKKRQTVKNELRSAPDGELMIVKKSIGMQYFQVSYVDGTRIRKGVGDNKALVYRLAHKAYLEELLKQLDLNIALMEKALTKSKPLDEMSILSCMPAHFNLLRQDFIINPRLVSAGTLLPRPVRDGSVRPVQLATSIGKMYPDASWIIRTPEDWLTLPYCENTAFLESKNHIAHNGLKVRSKSEVAILGIYGEKSIYCHYDELVRIGDSQLSPDFIVTRPDGSIFIHEHAGLWSDDYLRKNEKKLALYRSIGFVQGRNLLISFDDENGTLNLKLISELIDDMYNR